MKPHARSVPANDDVPAENREAGLDHTEAMYAALLAEGAGVQLTLYPHLAHDCWTETYQNPQLYAWFLQHQRKTL